MPRLPSRWGPPGSRVATRSTLRSPVLPRLSPRMHPRPDSAPRARTCRRSGAPGVRGQVVGWRVRSAATRRQRPWFPMRRHVGRARPRRSPRGMGQDRACRRPARTRSPERSRSPSPGAAPDRGARPRALPPSLWPVSTTTSCLQHQPYPVWQANSGTSREVLLSGCSRAGSGCMVTCVCRVFIAGPAASSAPAPRIGRSETATDARPRVRTMMRREGVGCGGTACWG